MSGISAYLNNTAVAEQWKRGQGSRVAKGVKSRLRVHKEKRLVVAMTFILEMYTKINETGFAQMLCARHSRKSSEVCKALKNYSR